MRRSGIGRQSGLEAFDGYFDIKAVMVNTANQTFDWIDMSQSDARLT